MNFESAVTSITENITLEEITAKFQKTTEALIKEPGSASLIAKSFLVLTILAEKVEADFSDLDPTTALTEAMNEG